jgi:hypothetical protein
MGRNVADVREQGSATDTKDIIVEQRLVSERGSVCLQAESEAYPCGRHAGRTSCQG